MGRWTTVAAAGVAGVLAVAVVTGVAQAAPGAADPGLGSLLTADVGPAAIGAPGALSHYDLARKDCLGTSAGPTSKVWYTIADGILSDVYAPYIDQTNVETLQYIVTDGATFTDLQSRDMTYTVAADDTGMVCTVTSTAKSGRYRLVSTYLTDPARDSVAISTRLLSAPGTSGLKLYVRYDASIGGNGGGGDPITQNGGADTAAVDPATTALVSGDAETRTDATNRDYAAPLAGALRASHPFLQAQSGFVGTASDGLTQLDATHQLTPAVGRARNGNVVQTALLDTGPAAAGRPLQVQLALGFGPSVIGAINAAGATAAASFAQLQADYVAGWQAYDRSLSLPTTAGLAAAAPGLAGGPIVAQSVLSANVLKSSEDKTFPGAVVASLASPWGQAVSAGERPGGAPGRYFGSYREVFGRDLYEAFTGFLSVGDTATAQATTRFLLERQQLADGRIPRNSLLNGKTAPDTGGDQLDETAYPILMAWQSGLAGDAALYTDHIRKAADFVVSRGPSFGVERWEEQSGYSPSTIAAEIAGLVAAAEIADTQGDTASARTYRAAADDFTRNIKGWTVTTTGPYSPDPYFIRLSKTGDPDAAIVYNLGNGGPDADQRAVVDAGFLELTRLGILPATDPDVLASLPVVDDTIARQTPSGTGFYRYGTDAPGSEDGYGDDAATGRPWPTTNTGTGHLWPVLSGERAEQQLGVGDSAGAASLLLAMNAYASGVGLVPEQDWEDPALPPSPYGTPPEQASIGFAPGRPAGSAAPLTWAQAQQLRLAVTLSTGSATPVEQPGIVADRYRGGPVPLAPLTVTAPADATVVSGATTTVTGTAAPGARVDVSVTDTDTGAATTRSGRYVGPSGTFAVTVPLGFGTNVITVAATSIGGATAFVRRTVVSDLVTGTTVLDVTDPSGDDNGPGTFVYPLAPDFVPGAFDLTRFRVTVDGDTAYLQADVRDLTPTFGDPLGAQLLTVFVHDPAAATTSTAPIYPSRNYSVAPADAWSRAIQVRGFAAPLFLAPDGTSAGDIGVQASSVSRTITMIVPVAALGGTPDSGWSFTLSLWGQDGFGQDGARAITPTPTDYTFGVCAAGSTDPRCVLDPAQAPRTMDTITPPGVDQSTELDALLGPVVLQGIAVE